ncbi:MAG: hypothetical protein DCC68_20875 [Planctomycetota bacterium]|nr:MAG: hypothetical protein DCC68_20875 [Planctomycetota bacterium]
MARNASQDEAGGEAGGANQWLAFLVFAVVSLAVGIGMLTIRHFALAETDAARSWVETPCTIEKNEIVRGSSSDDRPSLDVVYRYEFGGATYRGDRLDLLIGSMGDDTAWEQRIRERYPPGAKAVCYVDPADPTNSVFDRDHAATKSRNLWLIAFPFLCVGTCFSLAILMGVAGAFGTKGPWDSVRAAKRGWGDPILPPPRKISPLQRAVVLAGPLGSQLAIPFFVGFTFVFIALDGPNQYGQLIWPETRDQEATGKVTAVRELAHRELYRSVYEYDVEYEVG